MSEPTLETAGVSELSDTAGSDLVAPNQLAAFAGRVGCTEGQLYSMAIALTATIALVVAGGVPLGQPVKAIAVDAVPSPAPGVVVVPPGPSLTDQPMQPSAVAVLPALPSFPQPIDRTPTPVGTPSPASWLGGRLDFRVPAPGAPRALTVDTSHLYVGTDNGSGTPSRLVVFSRTGDQARLVTVTGQPSGHTGGLSAAAMHGADVLVTDRSRAALLELDPRSGAQRVLAQLPDLPPCLVGIAGTCQPGVQNLPPTPVGLAVTDSQAYIADETQGTIWRYTFATKQLVAWYTSSDFATDRGPSGLALDTSGNLVFTVAQTADTTALLKGALYRLTVASDGSAGARSLLASFDSTAFPGPVVVGRAGDVYVGLTGTGGVVAVGRTGAVTQVVGASASRVPAPGGLALANGLLYVADAGRPESASSGRVFAVPIADAPAV